LKNYDVKPVIIMFSFFEQENKNVIKNKKNRKNKPIEILRTPIPSYFAQKWLK